MKNTATESLGISMILALSGGFMDAYTYLIRGGVFASGQTCNFVLVAIRGVSGEYYHMIQSCVPIAAFWIGIFLLSIYQRK